MIHDDDTSFDIGSSDVDKLSQEIVDAWGSVRRLFLSGPLQEDETSWWLSIVF